MFQVHLTLVFESVSQQSSLNLHMCSCIVWHMRQCLKSRPTHSRQMQRGFCVGSVLTKPEACFLVFVYDREREGERRSDVGGHLKCSSNLSFLKKDIFIFISALFISFYLYPFPLFLWILMQFSLKDSG